MTMAMDAHHWWGSLLILVLVFSSYDGTSSFSVPLTDMEEMALDKCMSGLNSELDQLISDNKEVLCAISRRTQTKLQKMRMNFSSPNTTASHTRSKTGSGTGNGTYTGPGSGTYTGTGSGTYTGPGSGTNTGTGTGTSSGTGSENGHGSSDMETEQDSLGCSSTQTSALTNEQLIERVQELEKRLRNMTSISGVFQASKACAASSVPKPQNMSEMVDHKFRDVAHTMVKFGYDAVAALAKNMSISWEDRTTLKACYQPLINVMMSVFRPEITNKLTCAARVLQISSNFSLPDVDSVFPATPQTTPTSLNCSQFQFEGKSREDVVQAISGDVSVLMNKFSRPATQQAMEAARNCVMSSSVSNRAASLALNSYLEQHGQRFEGFFRAVYPNSHSGAVDGEPSGGHERCSAGSCNNGGTCDQQSGYCRCMNNYLGDSCQFKPNSTSTPLTDSEQMALDNCTAGLNSELDQFMSDNKEVLCAISRRTQTKLEKTRMKFFGIGSKSHTNTGTGNDTNTGTGSGTNRDTGSGTNTGTGTSSGTGSQNGHGSGDMETEQDHLGCSSSQTSSLTDAQLIERVHEIGNRLRGMTPFNGAFQRSMSCAASSIPSRPDISRIVEDKMREVRQKVLKFGYDTVSALAKNVQISSADRTALNACYKPLVNVLTSVVPPEMINKLTCAARVLQIPSNFSLPDVDSVFPTTPQTTPTSLNCSQFQFEGKSREDVVQAISGDVLVLMNNFSRPEIRQAMEAAKNCVMSSSVSNRAAAFALNSHLEQQGQRFEGLFRAVHPNSTSDENTGNHRGISESDRMKFKKCFTEFKSVINSKLQNNQLSKVMCAAQKLNMPLDLNVADVDKRFASNDQASGIRQKGNCDAHRFDDMDDDEVIQSLQDSVGNISSDFGEELSQKFNSGMQCLRTNKFENDEVANAFRNEYGEQAEQFEKFFRRVWAVDGKPGAGHERCSAGSCNNGGTCDQQSGYCRCMDNYLGDSCQFKPNSTITPLTDSEQMALDNCTAGLNNELDQFMSDNKEVLCAISRRTQTKLEKTRMKFFENGSKSHTNTGTGNDTNTGTGSGTNRDTGSGTNTGTGTSSGTGSQNGQGSGDMETEQDHLGCSSSQTSSLTDAQLIERVHEVGNRLSGMTPFNGAFQRSMSCAASSIPSRPDISRIVEDKMREVRQKVLKFGYDAVSALAKNMQITSADRTALKACYQPLINILTSVVSPEMINKLTCAARVLQIPSNFSLPDVDSVFPATPQTTPNSPDCSQFQFEGKSREDVVQAISGDVSVLISNFSRPEIRQAMEAARNCVMSSSVSNRAASFALNSHLEQRGQNLEDLFRAVYSNSNSGAVDGKPGGGHARCSAGSCNNGGTCDQQSGYCRCMDNYLGDSCQFKPNSTITPLTDWEQMALDNCTAGLNSELDQFMSDNKEVLCAISRRTQTKLEKTRMKFFGTGKYTNTGTGSGTNRDTGSGTNTGTGTRSGTGSQNGHGSGDMETEQDHLGCSSSQTSSLTDAQLIDRVHEVGNRLSGMTPFNGAFQRSMSCAASSIPSRPDISRIVEDKMREVRQKVLKFGYDAVSALAKNVQISSADRTALNACYKPLVNVLTSVVPPEMINKLTCAARVLQIPSNFSLPDVDSVFPTTPQTTPTSLNCSQFQFEGKSREDVVQAISGDVLVLMNNFSRPEIRQAMEAAKNCVMSSSVSNRAAAFALNSHLEQQGQRFEGLFRAVHPNSTSDENTGNHQGISESDRMKFKKCFTEFKSVINSKLQNNQLSKVMCAAQKLNISLDLNVADMDKKFPSNGQASEMREHNCDEYAFDSMDEDEVIQSVEDSVGDISSDFGKELSQKFNSGMQCLRANNFENDEAFNAFRNQYGERGEEFETFFSHIRRNKTSKPGMCPQLSSDSVGTCQKTCRNDTSCDGAKKCCSNNCGRVCMNPVTDQNPNRQDVLSAGDRMKFKNCFTDFNSMIHSRLQNDQLSKVMCAAQKLNMPLDLNIADVDKRFASNDQASGIRQKGNCDAHRFDDMNDDEVIQSLQDSVGNISSDFGEELSQKFNSGMQCLRTNKFENDEVANAFRNEYGEQAEQFEKFFRRVSPENRIEKCPAGKCGDSGTCNQTTGVCECHNNYTGMFCQKVPQIKVDRCAHVSCGSNGHCASETGNCVCKNRFTGKFCDIDGNPCEQKPCKNGGFCSRVMKSPGYKCLCKSRYTGNTCDTQIPSRPCDSQPCLNSGECVDSNDGQSFTCRCPREYTGATCQTEVPKPCASSPCKNGGVCVNKMGTNSYHCQCVKGWQGQNCTESSGCRSEVDCNDVCGGTAKFHKKCGACYGGNTGKTKDDVVGCDGQCDRLAQRNKCGVCYGGKTGRSSNHGIDACGDCTVRIVSSSTRRRVDCNGDCDGTAYFDRCSGKCVGGNTGLDKSQWYDCEGVCNGKMVVDSCGKCVPPYTLGTTGSQFKDCSGKCWTTLSKKMAVINECGQCVNDGSTGKDACGVCGGNGASCRDCRGVINGPTHFDPCGQCGGDGSSCNSISGVKPDIIPSGVDKTLVISGAGLAAGTVCKINNRDLTAQRQKVDLTKLPVSTGTNILPGQHTVTCTSPGQTARTTEFTVYDPNVFKGLQISKTEFEISGGTESLTITGAGADFIVGKTKCIITDTTTKDVVVVPATVSDDNLRTAVCPVAHPKRPTQLQLGLTFNDGVDLLKQFSVEAKVPPPTVNANFYDKMYGIEVTFKPGIGLLVKRCSDIFDATTVSALGPKAKCTSLSRQLLMITRITGTTISSLQLKSGVAKKAGESRAVAASGTIPVQAPSNPVPPVAVIRGPSFVSSCRNIQVSGLTSKGGLGRALTYSWTVTPSAGLTLEGQDKGKLEVVNAPAGQTFTISLTVCNVYNLCDQTTHSVQKSSSGIPDVKIRTPVDPANVKINKRVILIADVQLSSCANDYVDITWSFQGTNVQVDDSQINNRKYIFKPGQLQPNDEVVATVEVALRSDPSKSNTADITLHTTTTPLKAVVKGGKERTVGIDYGNVAFDGSLSYDPDERSAALTYEWSCQKITDQGEAGSCLTGSDTKDRSKLQISMSQLESNAQYDFSLRISRDLGMTIKTASTMVTLKTLPGAPPKITMRDLTEDETLDIFKPPMISAQIEASEAVTVAWEAEDKAGYAYIDLSASENVLKTIFEKTETNNYFAAIKLQPDVLKAGQAYMIWCRVLDSSGKLLSRSSVDFKMAPGVSGCEMVQPEPYTELSQTTVSVKNCQSDTAMSYHLSTENEDNEEERVGSKQETGDFELPLGPKPSKDNGNIFVVLVCPAFGGACQSVRSAIVAVTKLDASALENKATDVLNSVEQDLKEDNPMKGLFRLKIFFLRLSSQVNQQGQRKRRAASTTFRNIAKRMIDLAAKSLETELDEDKGKDILDTLRPIPPEDTSDDDFEKVVCQMSSVVDFNLNKTVKMQPNDIKNLHKWIKSAGVRKIAASKLCGLEEKLRKAQRIGMQFGERQDLNLTDRHTRILNSIPTDNLPTKDGADAAVVSFGRAVRNMFSNGSPVTIEMESFNADQNPYSTPADKEKERGSPVIAITLADPTTGEPLTSIKDLTEPITIEMPVTKTLPNKVLVCHYFDEVTQQWLKEGLVTDLQTADKVICKTTHLTAFAAFASDSENSPEDQNMMPMIAGAVAGVGLVVIIVLAVILYKRSKRRRNLKSSRTSVVTPIGHNI
ncbi:uncharacterized protein LOC121381825 [Gigantopelta aegis]|uniref:uncharacterized protein LOC121381825 n=1 Tax=Gigantopelta aegis TaxID=1735272 RepID=UPI001B88A561|nr:uncharacterized protein LOC121381825 [Gigantopelta aegis]